jgi:hypothetical protein
MSVTVICNGCNKSLKAPDHLVGKRVKCPACGNSVKIQQEPAVVDYSTTDPYAGASADPFSAMGTDPFTGGGAPAPYAGADAAQDGGGRQTPPAQQSGWRKFNLGLLLMSITVLVLSTVIGADIVLSYHLEAETLSKIQKALPYVFLAGVLTLLVGFGFCACIPRESGEKGMMTFAFLFFAPGASALLADRALTFADYFESRNLAIIVASAGAAGAIPMLIMAPSFFLFSLRSVAIALKSTALAAGILSYVVYTMAILPIWSFYRAIAPIFMEESSIRMRGGYTGSDPMTMLALMEMRDLIIIGSLLTLNVLWFAYSLKLTRDLVKRRHKL